MHKIDGNPAATDGQVPDAPARLTVEENAASNKRDQHLLPEVAEALRRDVVTNNSVVTWEKQHAEEELQEEPVAPLCRSVPRPRSSPRSPSTTTTMWS